MLRPTQGWKVLLGAASMTLGYQVLSKAAATQAKVGPCYLLASISSVACESGPRKVDYGDVVKAWTQSFKMVDQSKEEEAEIVKNRLREALKPEKLLEIVEKHTNDPQKYFIILSTDSNERVCDAACKSIEAEGFLPKELHLFAISGEICVAIYSQRL